MSSFELTIATPDGCLYKGPTTRVTVRTTGGEVTVLGHHINYVAALGMGPATIEIDGKDKVGCCIGGLLSMTNNVCRLVATTFEWADQIDVDRAKATLEKTEKRIVKHTGDSNYDIEHLYAKKQRNLVRIAVAEKYGK